MEADAFQRERALFEAVLALPRADRAVWLREACGEDESLRDRIHRLVRQADGSAPTPRLAVAITDRSAPVGEAPGSVVGNYRLLDLLGEGGFGSVYRAEQREPVQRTVALKIIKLGMDTKQVIARFEAERQALALMDHPGIARVLDAGATDSGRPYFVMDLVSGVPVTEYCDEHDLPTAARLDLFTKVCMAVQHAHQKGIIHRDLKPSNVLITIGDDGPEPKVIDFGIAKATGPPLTSRTLETGAQDLLGTPEYMSPEQARPGAVDVDTRSDIYSLGVLLYELLTGAPPFDRERTRSATLSDMQRMILEEVPPRPSAQRAALRGDLDRITMKALEKEPAHRYATAEAFAADIRRFLANEPVLAASPGAWYRARKFARRNRTTVTAGALVVAAVVIGAALATIGFAQARRDRDVATERLRDSYLAQARAARSSVRIGRRAQSLGVLASAAAIRPSDELRDEVIACLTLDDLVVDATLAVDDGAPEAAGLRSVDRLCVVRESGAVDVIRIEDSATMLSIAPIGTHPTVTVFSPTGRYLAIKYHTHDDRRLNIWDIERQAQVLALEQAEFHRSGIAFAPDERWLALTLTDEEIHVYDLPSGTHARSFAVDGRAWFLAAHPDGARLAVSRLGDGPPIRVVDVENGHELLAMDAPASIRGPAWSPDGRWLAGGGADNHVYLWDATTGDLLARLVGHQGAPHRVSFDGDSAVLASSAWDATVRLWDVTTGTPLLDPLRYEEAIGFGARLATFSETTRTVTFWRYDRSRAFRRMRASAPFGVAGQMDIDATGRWLVTAGETGVRLWDLRNEVEQVVLADAPARGGVFVPDPPSIVAVLADAGLVQWTLVGTETIGPDDAEVLWPRPGLGHLCLSADGRRVLVSAGAEVAVFDLAQRRRIRSLQSDGPTGRPSVTADARWLATGTWRGRAGRVWDLETGATVREFAGNHVVCVFATGAPLLAVSRPGAYDFLEVGTWSLRFAHRCGHESSAGPVTFSPDGRIAAIAHTPENIALLDCATGAVLAHLPNPEGKRLVAMRMTPDAQRLLACTPDSDVHIWDLGIIRTKLRALGLD